MEQFICFTAKGVKLQKMLTKWNFYNYANVSFPAIWQPIGKLYAFEDSLKYHLI